jgi:hypothetical protein
MPGSSIVKPTVVRPSGLIFALAVLTPALPAAADVHVAFADDAGHPASQMYIKDGKVRLEAGGPEPSVMLYDAASNTLRILMPETKEYLVFDEQTASGVGAQLQGAQNQLQAAQAQARAQVAGHQGEIAQAQAEMQAAMAKMSPQERARMEQMMASRGGLLGGSAAAPRTEIKDLGKSETIAGHRCKDVQIAVTKGPSLEMCVADADSLGIPAADLATLAGMREGIKKLAANMGPMAQSMQSMLIDGFAIRRQQPRFEHNRMVTTTETLDSISSGPISAGLLQVPRGYKEISLQDMMRAGGR